MSFEIYHQLGFRDTWNIDSIQRHGSGDGVIISPKNRKKEKVVSLGSKIKQNAIFDPQFCNPSESIKQMSTYDYYPSQIMPNGFDISTFSDYCSICAAKCVEFQKNNDFRYFIVPTCFHESIPDVDELTDLLYEQYISPFLCSIANTGSSKGIIVQLILNKHMIKNEDYAANLLDWITGIDNINGVYLITELSPRDKQIKDPDFLYSLLKFIDALNQNELDIILGYLNTEALLLSIANPSIVTIGSYENLRIFNPLNFSDKENSQMRLPAPRIFIPELLDWIDFYYIELLIKKIPGFKKLLGENEYTDQMLNPNYNMVSGKAEPYKHYFIESSKQLRGIAQFKDAERYDKLIDIIQSANNKYSEISEKGFEIGDYGSHLPAWLTAANMFASEKGWR